MKYNDALDFIHGTQKFGSKLGLENIKTLLELLGNPQKDIKFIHVAGTNGKGSTCSFLNTVLIEAGYRTGLYTSPFIETFNERMRIDHVYISNEELTELTGIVKKQVEKMVSIGLNHPTEFEVVTAIAMLYFKNNNCDLVVLEVGLGGRLDATNVIDLPLLSVITPLDLDHTEFLGDTIEKIAFEKAGIIKENGITIMHPQVEPAEAVIKGICESKHNTLYKVNFDDLKIIESTFSALKFTYHQRNYEIGLIGVYQAQNAAVAISVIEILSTVLGFTIEPKHIFEGLKKTKWLARLEVISTSPFIIIDGAHNAHGIQGLAQSLSVLNHDYKVIGILGILKDKDVKGMLDTIMPYLDAVVVTEPVNQRAMPAKELASMITSIPVLQVTENVSIAVDKIFELAKEWGEKTLFLSFGSLYLVGDVRKDVINHIE